MVNKCEINLEVRSDDPEKRLFKEENILNLIIKVDNIFGLRAIGIILYGALPSYLALVGILNIEIKQLNLFSSPLPIITLISILPISLTFMLIRSLHKEWYLAADCLNFRSAFATFMILLLATIISEISGVIHNGYVFGVPNIWDWKECKPIIESFLTAILSLVLTSTFVLTSFTRNINVPGLPSIEYTKSLKELRKMMKQMNGNYICSQYSRQGYDNFTSLVKGIENKINEISNLQGDYLAKVSLDQVKTDILNLKKVLDRIEKKMTGEKEKEWDLFFEASTKLNNKEKLKSLKPPDIELFYSVTRLRELKFEDLTCQKMTISILRFLHSIQNKLMK